LLSSFSISNGDLFVSDTFDSFDNELLKSPESNKEFIPPGEPIVKFNLVIRLFPLKGFPLIEEGAAKVPSFLS